jgi:hypothetical protein
MDHVTFLTSSFVLTQGLKFLVFTTVHLHLCECFTLTRSQTDELCKV